MEDTVNMSITFLVKDNYVHFDSYRQGFFYYRLNVGKSTYLFPIPEDDIGTATLKSMDKAITFMRWIRKAIEEKTFIEQ